jgi:hypothetical protein
MPRRKVTDAQVEKALDAVEAEFKLWSFHDMGDAGSRATRQEDIDIEDSRLASSQFEQFCLPKNGYEQFKFMRHRACVRKALESLC